MQTPTLHVIPSIIDVDSNNNKTIDGYDSPIEWNPNEPGKYILVNDNDDNDNGVLDKVDFTNNDQNFAELKFMLPQGLNPNVALVTFNFGGNTRIWDKNGTRSNTPITGTPKGDLIPAGTGFLASLLPLGGSVATLYIEGMGASTDLGSDSITCSIDPDGAAGPLGYVASDRVRLTVFSVDVAMALNHVPADNSDRALNLRLSEAANTEIIAPEWFSAGATGISPTGNDGTTNQKAVLYQTAASKVDVYVRFQVSPKAISSITVSAQGLRTKTGGGYEGLSIGNLNDGSGGDVTVTIDTATGVSNGPAAKAVNGINGFAKLTSSNNLADTVLREIATFRWQIAGVAGKEMVKQEIFKAQDIKMYTVLDNPRTPWNVADNTTADDTIQPWVSALEFATDPGKGGASGKNAADALAAITDFLFNRHGLVYSCRYGAPLYAYDVAGPAWSLHLSAYMNKTYGNVVNCYDQAVAVAALGDLLGINVEYCYMNPFGYINPTRLVGIQGDCNNPFFLSPPPQQQLVGVDLVLPDRRPFSNHAFARYSGNVYDACAGPALGTAQATYLTNTIDRSTPAEAAVAGGASNITVYPAKTVNGVY